jgi:hypothetical protein
MKIPRLPLLVLLCVPLLALSGSWAGEKEETPAQKFLPADVYTEIVQKGSEAIKHAIDSEDAKKVVKGRLAAILIAASTQNVKGDVGNPAGVRAAALRLAEILGERGSSDEAKKLAAALASLKGDASAKNKGPDYRQYVPNDYDLMVPYMPKDKGGFGLPSELQYTKRLQGTQEYIENLFNYLAQRAPKAADVKKIAPELEKLAYKTAVSAEVIDAYAPRRASEKRDPKIWHTTAGNMRAAALDLAEAAKKQDADSIQKAADKLSRSCVECHKVFQ